MSRCGKPDGLLWRRKPAVPEVLVRFFLADAAANGISLRGARLLDLGSGVIKHASVRELQHCLHLDADGIAAAAKEILHEKDPA